ncbi:hypothetical protein M0811_13319 [Anaeramoeba ignava]|uniref:F-box domain-containing protein n=1 Tax=Anaeramoeba ignava TaxID=1746090 RepID=A0A9Q0L655_ANAIG|nr:hypothetical protein M0811_13319 [Anaeramoeba ignava]
MDYYEQQKEEIEVTQSIFFKEVEAEFSEKSKTWIVKITFESELITELTRFLIIFELPQNYPNQIPKIQVRNQSSENINIPQEEIAYLQELLEFEAKDSIGEQMLFKLISIIREWLDELDDFLITTRSTEFLPDDIIYYIFKFIEHPFYPMIGLTCRRWYHIAMKSKMIWSNIIVSRTKKNVSDTFLTRFQRKLLKNPESIISFQIGSPSSNAEVSQNEILEISKNYPKLKSFRFYSTSSMKLSLLHEFVESAQNLTDLSIYGAKCSSKYFLNTKDFSRLQNISIRKSNIHKISVENLKNVIFLSLESNYISAIPHNIVNLSFLQHLNLDRNPLRLFPAILFCLPQLTFLSLEGCGFSDIDPDISNFHLVINKLEHLNLANNLFSDFPYLVTKIGSLKFLNLAKNRLRTVLPSLRDLDNLEYLNLNHNELAAFPEQLFRGNLKNIMYLKLKSNDFIIFPRYILENLQKLRLLDLRNNKLESLELSYWVSPNLNVLRFSNNLLRYIDLRILFRKTSSLRYFELDLSRNRFETFPVCEFEDENKNHEEKQENDNIIIKEDEKEKDEQNSLSKNSSLVDSKNNFQTNFSIQQNQEEKFEFGYKFIEYQVMVRKINLSQNSISIMPTFFYLFDNIQELDLSKNTLFNFQSEFFDSQNDDEKNKNENKNKISRKMLEEKDLFHPKVIEKLSETLTSLDLSDTMMAVFPVQLTKLSKLKKLNLSLNKLNFLPSCFFRSFNDLKRLELQYNLFETVPFSKGEILIRQGNEISVLANGFCLLNNLKYLDLSGNPGISKQNEITVQNGRSCIVKVNNF